MISTGVVSHGAARTKLLVRAAKAEVLRLVTFPVPETARKKIHRR